MKTKKRLTLISIFAIIWIIGGTQNKTFKPEFSTIINADKGQEMMAQCSRSTPEKIDGFWNLTEKDAEKLENNFSKITHMKSIECCISGGRIKNLKQYGYQYLGVKIENRKFIYINAFWIESKDDMDKWYKDWKIEPIIVCDGGESFWGVLFDIETSEFSQLSINGVA